MAQDQEVSRREFVKAAGAVTAVAAAIPAVHGAPAIQKVRAANDQVQFGIIGTGSRGSYLLKHLKGIDNGKCVAICDVNAENLKPVSYTHLRAHETPEHLVCRLLLE